MYLNKIVNVDSVENHVNSRSRTEVREKWVMYLFDKTKN